MVVMIARLTGRLLEKSPGRVVIDVQGVGYQVLIPFSTYYTLKESGETVSLHIYTYVKEDALSLYGFSTPEEQRIFTQLIQISGIGPKLAITILSGLPAEELVRAIGTGDAVRLNAIPGVGKKTAERMLVELRDKLAASLSEVDGASVHAPSADAIQRDVVSALVNLGYPSKTAKTAVFKSRRGQKDLSFEELLKDVLRKLAG